MIVLFSSQKDSPLEPKLVCCTNLWFFGDDYSRKKLPNGVQRQKQLRHFITLYNTQIYTDEQEEEVIKSEDNNY